MFKIRDAYTINSFETREVIILIY